MAIELAEPARLLTWMANSSEYPPSSRELRPYQQEASERLRDALLDTGRGQLVLATGLGKTVILAETVASLVRDGRIPGNRVLVLAHTRPLVEQLLREFWFQLPKSVATHRFADHETPAYWDGITFGTIQSISRSLDTLPEFGLVVVDEAHHVGAPTFREAITSLRPSMLAGVTATPWRGDGYDIGPPSWPALGASRDFRRSPSWLSERRRLSPLGRQPRLGIRTASVDAQLFSFTA